MENGKIAGIGTTDQFLRAQTDQQSAAQIVKNATEARFPNRPQPEKKPDITKPIINKSFAKQK